MRNETSFPTYANLQQESAPIQHNTITYINGCWFDEKFVEGRSEMCYAQRWANSRDCDDSWTQRVLTTKYEHKIVNDAN
jgi:hypothetical protein